MMVIKFRSSEEHEDLLKKVKKMKKFTEDLEDCLEEAMEDDFEYRGGSYRKEYDEDDMKHYERMNGRYGYRRGRM
jgi:hypothetical protein